MAGNMKVPDILSAAVLVPPNAQSTPFRHHKTERRDPKTHDGRSKSNDKISFGRLLLVITSFTKPDHRLKSEFILAFFLNNINHQSHIK